MCYKYISTILYTAVSLLKDLLILSQMTVTGTESSGCVNYTIKKIIDGLFEEIICITKGKQNQLDSHRVVFSSLHIRRNFMFK